MPQAVHTALGERRADQAAQPLVHLALGADQRRAQPGGERAGGNTTGGYEVHNAVAKASIS
jgi:hypothetical protein